ncbi:hypothetical protein NXF25_007498 [Crotalus adamanteus]|uniref:SPATA31 domain-containing protein n=1 Tax=Crotalus adamanteus TaxID=8729 RepID=A0AAW1C2F9_CROAD
MAPLPPSCILLPLDGCFALCSTLTLALLLFLSKRSPRRLLAWDKALPRARKGNLPLTTELGATRGLPSWTQLDHDQESRGQLHEAVLDQEEVGSSSSRKTVFVAIDLPFVSETVLEKLEQHLVVKRMQNAIGLPVILLRSLKAFLPFAPSPIIRWSLKREVVVVTRPQVLPFKSVATRRRLEQHVKKRAHLKHWRLPRKIQEVLRHMKTDVHPTVPGEEGSGGEKSPSSIRPPHLTSTSRDATLDYPLHSKPRFRVHIAKKLFQIAHETFPKRVEESQKISASEEKKIVLPKLIKLHWRSPQARGGPSLGLRRKADSVEMNIKRKHLQHLWLLPTVYSQSLSKMAPMTSNLPATPSQVFHPSEFSHAATPFLPTSQRQLLDSHVLRKKVQHQWGQPKLVQQSLRQFLSAAPPAAPVSPAIPKGPQADIIVAPRNTLPFVPLEINRKLDDHIKRTIIERQWGVPQRVMKSLQMFMPMPPSMAKIAREREKEKVAKRSPSVKDPGPCKLSQVLQKHVAQKALEIHLGEAGPFSTLRQTDALWDREDALPRLISPGSRTLQLRSKELLFMELTALEHVELSVRHKDLAHKWGLPTLYQKSLSHLFTGAQFQVPPSPLSRRALGLEFSPSDIAFISQGTQEDLEWHVRRKRMQHMWGLASLVQKSLKLFLPPAPHWHAAGHTEVTTLPAEIPFLGDGSIHELERDVRKRLVLQRWLLPRRLLEPVKMLGSQLAVVSGPSREMKKPRRATVSSLRQPEVFHLPPRGKALKEMETHLEKKHMEILLGVKPTVARFSWQHATFTPRQPLPKLILPGHSFLQPRCRFLPFERPEDVAQIEQTLKHKWLMSLWGLSIQYVEALGGMMPKPPRQPLQTRLADRLVFSEVKVLFLQENIRGAFEGHIRWKRLQHEWGLPDMIQRSLRGFMEGAPSQLSPQNVTEVQVLHKELTFLPQDSSQFLELHIHRRKHQHQWGLPKRVLEAMKGLGVESIAGPQSQEMQVVDQSQVGLEPSETGVTNGEKASQPPSTGDRSPPETLFFRGEAEKKIHLLFLKKCVEVHMGVFPGVAMQSWQRLPPSRAPLPKPASSGSWTPQPRRSFLPFVRTEDAGRLELAILHHRLTSLWSLGRVYVGGIAALQPRMSSSHRRPREEELSKEQTLSLQAEVREALELHVKKKRLEHGWGFPRLIQKSLQGFMERAPVQPSLQKMDSYAHILYQAPAFLPSSTYTQLESHIQRSERDPRSTTQQPGATSAINGKGPNQRPSQAEAKDLLECHVLHKKICHEWGLPRIVQKSLSAFCPPLPKPQIDQGSVGESLETVEEDGASNGKNIFQEDEMKLLAESQQVTKEEVSKTPQDSKRDSVSTKATETEKLTLASEMLEPSEEIISTAIPIMEATEGESSQEMQPEEGKARISSPKGRSSSCDKPELTVPYVLLQQGTPKQDLLTCSEPEDYGSSSSLPPQSSYDKYNASRRDSQTSDSSEVSSLEGNAESMPSSSIEQLLWDKESFSRQLEHSMQGMVRHSASPSGLRQSGRQPVTYAPYECGTTVCERDVGQKWEEREEAFPMARDAETRSMASLEDNEIQKTHQAGGMVQGHLPEQENLLKPSEVATNPLFRSHIVQRALGSFILPACVISSYSTCEDVEVELIRQAGRKHRQRLSAQLLEEKPVLEKERESPPEQGQGVGGGRPLRSATLHTGEPKDLAHRDFREPPPPPPSPNLSTIALDQQDREGSQITGEASVEGSELSKLLSKKFSAVSSLEAGSELPAPPSDWLQSETGAESEYEDGSSLVITPHQQSMQQNPMSSEDQSQFSTEDEWDRVGDWATEDMNSEGLTMEEENSHLDPQERPTEGSSLKAEASSRSQARSASSSSRKDKTKGFSIIGSVLERKLSLKQGMNFWQRSQGSWLTTWKEKKRHGVPSEAEEGRAGFSGDLEHTLEGDAAERWMDPHHARPSKGETFRQGETHVPQTQTFLMARPGFHHRGDTSTGSFSTHCQASRSSSEDYIQERNWGPEGALAWDRTGHKTSALASVARKRRNAKTQSLERAAERGAGGRTWGPSRRKMRVVKRDLDTSGREESSSSSREERPSNGGSGSEGQPAALAQGAAKTREGGPCRRREESPMPERTIHQPLPQAEQEDKARQPTAWKSPQNSEGSPERDLLRLSPRECQPAGREGSPLEDSLGGCGVSEATAPPGRPTAPLPHGEQFRNLKERILLRRKELWSSPEKRTLPQMSPPGPAFGLILPLDREAGWLHFAQHGSR